MPDRRNINALFLVGVLVILLAAFIARVIGLDAQSLWYDEGNSVQMVFRSVPEIIDASARDIHPPLYYLVLSFWGRLFGTSEFALRYLSLLWGLLLVPVVIRFALDSFSEREALIAGLFIALHPFQVYYSQEARMYALLVLLVALSVLLFFRVLRLMNGLLAKTISLKKAWGVLAAFVLVNAAGLYTHYSFPLIMVFEAVVFVVMLFRVERPLRWLVAFTLVELSVLLLFAPILPVALQQLVNWPKGVLPPLAIGEAAMGLVFGFPAAFTGKVGWLVPPFLLAILGLLPSPGIEPDQKTQQQGFFLRVLLLFFLAFLYPFILFLLDAMTEANLKFLLPANLALWVLIARGFIVGIEITAPDFQPDGNRPAAVFGLVVGLGLAVLWPLFQTFTAMRSDPLLARDDYRGLVAYITEESGVDAAVVLSAPNQAEVFSYYLPQGRNVLPLRNLSDAASLQALESLVAEHDRIYGVYWGELQHDPGRTIELALEQRAFSLKTQWFGGIRLVTYVRPAPPAQSMAVEIGAQFGDEIILEGFTLSDERLTSGDAFGVTLFWRAAVPIDRRYKVFVHIYNPDGTILSQHDSEPSGGLYPFTEWSTGEQVIDAHGLLIPDETLPGEYPVVIGIYDPSDANRRLTVEQTGALASDSLTIASIIVN